MYHYSMYHGALSAGSGAAGAWCRDRSAVARRRRCVAPGQKRRWEAGYAILGAVRRAAARWDGTGSGGPRTATIRDKMEMFWKAIFVR
jgi:hypothetical protein